MIIDLTNGRFDEITTIIKEKNLLESFY